MGTSSDERNNFASTKVAESDAISVDSSSSSSSDGSGPEVIVVNQRKNPTKLGKRAARDRAIDGLGLFTRPSKSDKKLKKRVQKARGKEDPQAANLAVSKVTACGKY